jgi:hypothetical protein
MENSPDAEKIRAKLEFQNLPSHSKVASVLAKYLPHCDSKMFSKHFEETKPAQAQTQEDHNYQDAVTNTYGTCCKIPIWNLMQSTCR